MIVLQAGGEAIGVTSVLVVAVISLITLLGAAAVLELSYRLDIDFSDYAEPIGSDQETAPTWTRDDLLDLSSREFEHAVSAQYEAGGFVTNVSDEGPDAGVDILAKGPDQTIAIQAKRYRPEDRVSRRVVQRIHAAAQETGADRGAVVTTSEFSKHAEESAEALGVYLIDGEQVARELTEREVPKEAVTAAS